MKKNFTLLMFLVSVLIPMNLCAQSIKGVSKAKTSVFKGERAVSHSALASRGDGMTPQPVAVKSGILNNRKAPVNPSGEVVTWDFEDEAQFSQWTTIDSDGDNFNWEYFNNNEADKKMTAHDGDGLVASASYDNDSGTPLTPDNWLISPQVVLGGALKLWACGQDKSYYGEVFGVFVCEGNSTNPADYVQVGSAITISSSTMTEYQFDLSAYAGKTGRFAIRHYNVTDMFWLNIDDVTLDPTAVAVPEPTAPETVEVTPSENSAEITWEDNDDSSWNLRYRKYNPYLWDLEDVSELADWIVYDADGDGSSWGWYTDDEIAHSESGFLFSFSYDDSSSSALTPDNWLISPEVPLSGTLSVWASSLDPNYLDSFGVFVIPGSIDDEEAVANMVQLGADITAPAEWTQYTFDLSQFAGQTGHFIIRHYNSSDNYALFIDDIELLAPGEEHADWNYVTELSTTSATIDDLTPGTQYEVQVQAINESKESAWSAKTFFITQGENPAAISSVQRDVRGNEKAYTLSGVRVNKDAKLQKGIIITNGRKVIK